MGFLGVGPRRARLTAIARAAAYVCMSWSTVARAQSDAFANPNDLQVHAFISQGFIQSSGNNYLSYSQRGAFDYTEAAVNITANLTDNLRVGGQLFSRDLGPNGTFIPQFDWAYLDYRFRDWFGVRAGRVKIPFGLYNEGSEADQARVPVLLPQSIYPIDHQDYLLAETGGEVYGNFRLGRAGALEYRAYGGTLQVTPPASSPGITVANLSVPYVWGGWLAWSTPIDGLLLGGSFQDLRFDWDYDIASALSGPLEMVGLLPKGFTGTLPVQFRVTFYVASAEYQTGDLTLSSEYSRWVGDFDSAAPALLPPNTVNERYYVMASYRVSSWFTPGIYYSAYYPNIHQRSGRQNYQNDLAVTARYDLNKHWLVKLEGHFMDGTADLDSSLKGGQDLSKLTKDWGVLLVKTTAYF